MTPTRTTTTMPTWRFCWALIRFQLGRFLYNTVGFSVMICSWLIPGWVMQAFFNLITGDAPVMFDFWGLMALLVAGTVARIWGLYGMIKANIPYTFRSHTLLHKNMLQRIFAMPGAAALPESTGAAISRFRDDVNELPWFTLWINNLIGFALFAIVAVAIMLSINPTLTLVAFAPLVLIVLAAHAGTRRIEKYREATRKAGSAVTNFIAETFGAVQAVKVARAELHVIDHFAQLNEQRRKAALLDRLFEELLESIFVHSGNIGTGIILLLSARTIGAGAFTVGDFALFVYFLGFFTDFVSFVGFFWARYKQAGVSVKRMTELLQGAPAVSLVTYSPIHQDGDLPAIPAPTLSPSDRLDELVIHNLTSHYSASGRGIAGVNLHIRRGSFTVITGRIGSGKTTLLRALLGLLPAQEGLIEWNGQPVTAPADFFTPPRCAYTAQTPRLFSDTLHENLLLGLPDDADQLRAAIHAAVFERDVEQLEEGLETRVGPKGVKLSGGQLQRAAAARMFVRQAELLVFDDISSALDVDTEQQLWVRLFARAERPTCLVVSHRRTALRQADHVIVLKDGRVEDEGKLEELLLRCAEMQRLWAGEYSAP
jgi:ATP-binding cassette subfamily B protein